MLLKWIKYFVMATEFDNGNALTFYRVIAYITRVITTSTSRGRHECINNF